ncbi:MAG: hypothetical protein R3F29_06975 [Planctomycetota bacterium]
MNRFLFLLSALPVLAASLSGQCGRHWVRASAPGADDLVYTSLDWDPDGAGPAQPMLVIGGEFRTVGDVSSPNLASWDYATSSWRAWPVPLNGEVLALAVLPDHSLVAAGNFTIAGSTVVNRVARWDGSAWHPFGFGCDSTVTSLVVDANGDLLVGGNFVYASGVLVNKVARWNGSSWSALLTGPGFSVTTMVRMANGDLAASTLIGTVKRWDGSNWSSMGTLGYSVRRLFLTSGGALLAGGEFSGKKRVAQWDGANWVTMGLGFTTGEVATFLELPNGDLVAGGSFVASGSTSTRSLARWDGAAWQPMTDQLGRVRTLHTMADGRLFAGGDFLSDGLVAGNRVAAGDGTNWSPMASGIDGAVTASALLGDGRIVVGGDFSRAGDVAADNIAIWDGTAWSAFGDADSYVQDLAVASNGDLLACGSFSQIGAASGSSVARWDGVQWTAIPGGPPVGGTCIAGHGDRVVLGGSFNSVGGVAASNIAMWDGSSWSALGTGTNGMVEALVFLPDGSLVAAGSFSAAGGVTGSSIAKWDGTAWQPLGSGLVYPVHAIALDRSGQLLAAHSPVGLTRWDGVSWQPVGSGLHGRADAVVPLANGDIWLAGWLYLNGSPVDSNVVRWDGATWSAPHDLASGGVATGVAGADGSVWFGGPVMRSAQGLTLGSFAQLEPDCPASVAVYGVGCDAGNGALTTQAVTSPWLGSSFRTRTTGMPSDSIAVVVTGFQPAYVDLWTILAPAVPGCQLLTTTQVLDIAVPSGSTLDVATALPNAPAVAGVPLLQQVLPVQFFPVGGVSDIYAANALVLVPGVL